MVQIPCQFKRVQLTHNCGEDNEMISVWCKNCDKMCRWGALNIDSDGQRLPGGDNGRAKPGRKGKKASGSMGMLEVGESYAMQCFECEEKQDYDIYNCYFSMTSICTISLISGWFPLEPNLFFFLFPTGVSVAGGNVQVSPSYWRAEWASSSLMTSV